MSKTTAGKLRTSIALDPDTHAWLSAQANGYRGIGNLIEKIVHERRTVEGLRAQLDRIEQLVGGKQCL
jgi:hypothetical protein